MTDMLNNPFKRAHELRIGDVILVDIAGSYPVDIIAVEHGPLVTVVRWGAEHEDWVRFTRNSLVPVLAHSDEIVPLYV